MSRAPISNIRPVIAADIDSLAEIHAASFAESWSAASLGRSISAPAALTRVMIEPETGRVLGFVLAFAAAGDAEILTLAVAPDARCHGVGRSLVTDVLAALTVLGTEQLTLEVDRSNVPAIALYRHLGFIEIARRASYYETAGATSDAIVMARPIARKPPP